MNPNDEQLSDIVRNAHVIALVGASNNPERVAHAKMQHLLAMGFTVLPVNPNEASVLGQKAYPSLATITEHVDVVDVFRRAEDTPPLADETAKLGAKVLWLQEGIRNEETARRGADLGLTVVQDLCFAATSKRLRQHTEALIDESNEESFPASDPPAHHS